MFSELGIGVLHNKLKPKEYNLNNIKYFCGSKSQINGLFIHGSKL